ncbi:MAG: hypothetical protein H7Y06_06385 [Opitutaceae bacterium]|nr:hypothetical protein [Opitutaceae bacterium]
MKSAFLPIALLFACALLAGCASTQTKVIEKGRSLKGFERYFVLRNLKDNQAVEKSIVRALQARGFEVSSGPITLLPANAQVVIMYEDRWSWDFGNHMVYLKLGARDPSAVFPYVTASYLDQVAIKTNVDEVAAQLIDELLAAGH